MSASTADSRVRRSCLVAATALAAASVAVTAAPAQAVPGLTGRSFVSTTVLPTPTPGGGQFQIAFASKDRVSLTAGCNRMMGTVKAYGDRLRFSRLASTMMACPPPRDKADAWVNNFTRQAPTYKLVGSTLTLSTRGTTVVMSEAKPR